jgi:hypothetical protein
MKNRFTPLLFSGFILLAVALTVSCEKEYYVPFPTPDVVSYTQDMQPFFNAKCTNCHGNAAPNLESPDSYDNLINGGYIDLANPANSTLYISIDVGGKMESYATPEERAMTLKWIEQGAKNN